MSGIASSLPPAALLILGAFLLPLLRGRVRAAWTVVLPALSLWQMLLLPHGDSIQTTVFGQTLTLARVDALSLIFGTIFHIAAILAAIYAVHVDDPWQQVAAATYGGAGIAAVFAGDLLTLFVYWELTAITSVFLIWARRTERSRRAGMRYLIIQVASGVMLLGGAALLYHETGSIEFGRMTLGGPGTWLIFLAFGIKAAFPLLHTWLEDAYPEATVTGTVVLSAFTTKLAIYALARGFPGTELLIPIGATMTAFPIFFAVIENDLRRVLAYSLNNQLGFMVVGIGIGTELSLNGTAAHAFCHILYKALLFMSMGAVLHRTGTIKGSELGGLYRSMPWTTAFCCVGAASISAFPLFSGFVSKSLIVDAAVHGHLTVTWLVLLFASAGVFHHSGIKIPFFAFFAHDSGIRCKEAPWNMLLAMGLTAAGCIGLGVFPRVLYAMLPYPVEFEPYTAPHVLTQLQLLMFSALAFSVLWRYRIYPKETPSVNLDVDWFYRRAAPTLLDAGARAFAIAERTLTRFALARVAGVIARVERTHGHHSALARTWATSTSVMWVVLLLGVVLVLYYA